MPLTAEQKSDMVRAVRAQTPEPEPDPNDVELSPQERQGSQALPQAQVASPTLNEPKSHKIARLLMALAQGVGIGATPPDELEAQRNRAERISDKKREDDLAQQRENRQAQSEEERLQLERDNAYHARRTADATLEIHRKMADIDYQVKSQELATSKEIDPIKRQVLTEDLAHKKYLRDVYLPGELAAKQTEAAASATRAKAAADASDQTTDTEVTESVNTKGETVKHYHKVKSGAAAAPASGASGSADDPLAQAADSVVAGLPAEQRAQAIDGAKTLSKEQKEKLRKKYRIQ